MEHIIFLCKNYITEMQRETNDTFGYTATSLISTETVNSHTSLIKKTAFATITDGEKINC
jgi:hypothetical protein